MKVLWKASGLAGLGALFINALPASAQVQANSQEADVYAGGFFGDHVIDRRFDGQRPRLDDSATFGLRYGYSFTDALAIEGTVGYTPTKVTHFPGAKVDMNLWVVDADLVYHFLPTTHFVPYLFVGGGWVSAQLDRELTATVNGVTDRIGDDNGVTVNGGFGAKYFATDKFLIRLEGRYRYMDKVVDRFDRSINSWEATLGVGYRF